MEPSSGKKRLLSARRLSCDCDHHLITGATAGTKTGLGVGLMNKHEPVRDAINLLSGAKIRRTSRPGERFDTPETVSVRRIMRIQAWLLSMFMARL
jgi:hypothetical protein